MLVIEFHLDRGSGVSTYLQLVHQVKQAMRLGALRAGDQLPTAREVVEQLAINPNTVLKAYRELEREGLVVGRPGMGTFVQRTLGGVRPAEQTRLRGGLLDWIGECRRAGLDEDDMRALFDAALMEAVA
jgi:GntR family transcriptional regulator